MDNCQMYKFCEKVAKSTHLEIALAKCSNYRHMAKFCHFLKKSNGILPIVHNRQNETRISLFHCNDCTINCNKNN